LHFLGSAFFREDRGLKVAWEMLLLKNTGMFEVPGSRIESGMTKKNKYSKEELSGSRI
jgi:hypothetical protein